MITSIDKNTALVVIDLQISIVHIPLVQPMDEVLQNSAKLVNAFHKAGLPVVIVNVNSAGSPASKTRKDSSLSGSTPPPANALDIVSEIVLEESDIRITKTTWSAFYKTDLNNELQKRGITQIVLAGVATSMGVESTARQANELGYNIAFASDAIKDLFIEAHTNSLKYIFPRLGEVGSTEEIINTL